MSMYTTTSNSIHYNNDLSNINTWSIQKRCYPQAPQNQFTHCRINMTSDTIKNSDAMESSNKLKHKEVMLYKTESCRNWTELGHCRYGKKCRYAHGSDELRTVPRHNRYKTQICRAYHMDGSCPYGIRCTFVHDSDVQSQQHMKNSGDHYVDLPFVASQPPPPPSPTAPSIDLDVGIMNRTIHHNPFRCIRRKSSFGSHDDESSFSGSSSGDESVIGASLIDFNQNNYRHQNAKDLMMKRQEPIETMYHIHHHNNFNNNNRTIIWM